MLSIRKILHPTDLSPCANQALGHAVRLARDSGAELHLFQVEVLHGDDADRERFVQLSAEELVRQVLDPEDLSAPLPPIHKQRRRGVRASDAILDYAVAEDVDLIVLGTHGSRKLGSLFIGSVAREVARSATCPVLTVREREEPRAGGAVARILVPTDFSNHAEAALEQARTLAQAYGATLQLLHVVQLPVYPAFYGAPGTGGWQPDFQQLIQDARTHLENLTTEKGLPPDQRELHVRQGIVPLGIAEAAKELDSDLLVISTHGLSGVQRLLWGSTTERVLGLAECPVLILRAFGKSLSQA